MSLCEQCGNPTAELTCPFCNFEQSLAAVVARRHALEVVNLKEGMPLVHDASARLLDALDRAMLAGTDLLLVVHGYGSTGVGGEIRRSVRRTAIGWVESGRIHAVHAGEDFVFDRAWQKRCPSLERKLGHANPGVTLLELGPCASGVKSR